MDIKTSLFFIAALSYILVHSKRHAEPEIRGQTTTQYYGVFKVAGGEKVGIKASHFRMGGGPPQ